MESGLLILKATEELTISAAYSPMKQFDLMSALANRPKPVPDNV